MKSAFGHLPVSGHYVRKRLRLAGFARWLAGFSLVTTLAGFAVYRFGGIELRALIGLFLLCAGMGLLAFLLSCYSLMRVWFGGVLGGGKSIAAFVLAVLALLPLGFAAYLLYTNPRANLAYTEGMEPDTIGEVIETAPTAAERWRLAINAEDRPSLVTGRRYFAVAPEVYKAVRLVLADRGWEVNEVEVGRPEEIAEAIGSGDLGVSGTVEAPIPTPRSEARNLTEADLVTTRDSDRYQIEATAEDFVFELPSDIVIRIQEDGNETFVDARSASRAIGVDFGQNRRFLESFFDDLDTALAGQVATSS